MLAALRPTAGVGVARQLRLPRRLFAAAVPQATGDVDELVVARARRGDQDAFAQIVGHYDHRLRAVAFRLLGDRDRMDDVLQEVYVKAFRALPRFNGGSALGTWLYRITYNACMDDLRRRPATTPVSWDDEQGRSLVDAGAGPADIAVRRQDLSAALDRLPPDQRTAVLLVDAYGLDYADAAEVLGVRAGTIGSRLSRARAVLRAALGGGDE
jgi:RNA polymerase sigma-70 factor (ECF subfamily)